MGVSATDSENPRHGSLPSHCITAFLTRGVGTCECHQGQRCALGKLGRLLAHGEATSPVCGGHHDPWPGRWCRTLFCGCQDVRSTKFPDGQVWLGRRSCSPKSQSPTNQRSATASCQEFTPEVPLTDTAKALMHSQHGPLASAPFTTVPTTRMTRFEAQLFRVILCRRLHLPLLLSSRTCRCGRQLDSFGHHRATCAEAGVLGKRRFTLECAAA